MALEARGYEIQTREIATVLFSARRPTICDGQTLASVEGVPCQPRKCSEYRSAADSLRFPSADKQARREEFERITPLEIAVAGVVLDSYESQNTSGFPPRAGTGAVSRQSEMKSALGVCQLAET